MDNSNQLVHSFPGSEYYEGNYKGLTKREYFAALVLQGLCGGEYATEFSRYQVAEKAVGMADALIKELEKQKA